MGILELTCVRRFHLESRFRASKAAFAWISICVFYISASRPTLAGCPGTNASLAADQGTALGAWASVNPTKLDEALVKANDTFGCMEEIVDPETAAGWLRLQGMVAFRAGKRDEARAWFVGATAAWPDYHFPDDLIPTGNSLSLLYEDAHATPKSTERAPMDLQKGLDVYINGEEAQDRPLDRPAVFQVQVWPAGVVWTGVLDPGEALPTDDMPELRPALEERDRRVRISRRLAVVASASAVAAAGLEAAVWSTRDASGERATLSTPLAITMHGAALAAGGLAIGSGGAALMVRW